jgi:hypothetical protein
MAGLPQHDPGAEPAEVGVSKESAAKLSTCPRCGQQRRKLRRWFGPLLNGDKLWRRWLRAVHDPALRAKPHVLGFINRALEVPIYGTVLCHTCCEQLVARGEQFAPTLIGIALARRAHNKVRQQMQIENGRARRHEIA